MKKRFLSLLLALVMVVSCVSAATAAGSGFSDGSVPQTSTDGAIGLASNASFSEEVGSGLTEAKTTEPEDPEEKYITEERFSESEAAEGYEDDDVVNFIVVMKKQPLLAAGFTADDIAAQTAAVERYQNTQYVTLDHLKTCLTDTLGDQEAFKIGFTYTIATTGVSVTAPYGEKAAIEAMPGVDHVYVAPMFRLPADIATDTGDSYQPMTSNATTMIGADQLNATGYTGKGMKVAILDTGIVVDHPCFQALPEDKLTDSSMTKESVQKIWNTLNASGAASANLSYYNSKLPFIFNYTRMNFDVSHATAGSDHGTHVAGIAAANRTDTTSVVGVAPDAQLVVMQVFNGSGASWDTIMAALEDCIRLDVDVANLSLGSAAGFTSAGGELAEVLNLFTETDMEVVIAAGNDTNNAYENLTGLGMSRAGNPDIGLVGTPSTYSAALSVASVDNDGSDMLYFTVGERVVGFNDTASYDVTKFLNNFQGQTLTFVAVPGYGAESDYEGLDVEGKVAVVSRGNSTFPEKQSAAQKAGAIACVVYNNALGHFLMQINSGGDHIPCVSISQSDGAFLAEMGSGSLTVCNGDLVHISTDRGISSFSSWGVTPDLKLKPEIAGVGGSIYSATDPSISGSNYGTMSGTSMASPQVAGAMAVLMQYLRENYDYEEEQLRQVAADLMMSTANPLLFSDLEYSPRTQGAGLVDLVKATASQAYLSSRDADEGRPKGEFGDDDARTGEFEFGFEINNMASDQDLTYTFDSSVLTETLYAGEYMAGSAYALNAEIAVYRATVTEVLKYDFNDDGQITTADARVLLRHVNGVENLSEDNTHYAYTDVNGDGKTDKNDVDVITAYCAGLSVAVDLLAKAEVTEKEALSSITVPAGETVSLTARIQLTDSDKAYIDASFPNGMYVEGYLYANAVDSDGVNLSMPFVGFYGDWSDAPVFDAAEEENVSLYERLVFLQNSVTLGSNPYIRNGASGDQYNAFSYTSPIAEIDFGMLRNAKQMTFTVVDKASGVEYFNYSVYNVTKSYYSASYGTIVPFYIYNASLDEEAVWKGFDQNGAKLPDGTTVIYTVSAWLDDGDDEVDDTYSFEVTLDNQSPEIVNAYTLQEDLKIEDGKVILPLTLKDDRYIAAVLFVNDEGIIMGKYAVDNTPGEEYKAEYDITGFGTDFTIVVADYACNETEFDAKLNLGEYSDMTPSLKELSKDRLYGCETYDVAVVEGGWFSANKADLSDPRNETFDSSNRYYSAEYVNGYLVAQSAATGDLMLVTPTSTYWNTTTLVSQNGKNIGEQGVWVLYDMALDYSGKYAGDLDPYGSHLGTDTLFAVGWLYDGDHDGDGKDDGHNALFQIWVSRWNGSVFVDEVAQITGLENGTELLTLGCTTEGDLYGIDTSGKLYRVDVSGECTYIGTTDFVNELNYSGCNVIQSMGYDHNTDAMYWYAHSQTASGNSYINVCMTYTVNLETGACTEVGTYGPSGQTCLFVPTDLESDLFTMGVDPSSFDISPYQLTMATGQTKRMTVNWSPWNARTTKLTWESLNPEYATVDDYGFVTAVSEGTAKIQATAQVWDSWAGDYDPSTGAYTGEWTDRTVDCEIRVVGSNDLYAYIVSDFVNPENDFSWVTFSDQTPGLVTQIAKQNVTVDNGSGEPTTSAAVWQGGAYYNGYIYTVQVERAINEAEGTYTGASVLYRSKVTKGETPKETTFGEPEKIGAALGVEVGNLGFDYNTGRMYCVDYTNGGLGIIDLDTGEVDLLGTFSGDFGGPAIAPAMCVTADGTIVISSMYGDLYTVDSETLSTTRIGSTGEDCWYYASMTYDYDTGNIYWNPCMGNGTSPLYLVRLDSDRWSGKLSATLVKLGSVSSKGGVETTVLFTIPTEEPETKQIPVEAIEITNGDAVAGLVGGTLQLNTVTTPERPTVRARTWESSNPNVVTVDRLGMLNFVGVGEAEVTVSIRNKNPEDGGPFTDTVKVTVYEAAGKMEAFLAYEYGGSQYYDYWVDLYDYAVQESVLTDRAIGNYTLRSAGYYDGYFYGYDKDLQFIRVSADNHVDYVVLTSGVAEGLELDSSGYATEQVTSLAYDYTDAVMYGLVLPVSNAMGYLASIDLRTGTVTKLVQLDAKVYALAIDGDGTLYAAGSTDAYTDAKLYTIDKGTGTCTVVKDLTGARVYTGSNNYGMPQYNAQMTYDYTTDRLYLNATSYTSFGTPRNSGLLMIDLEADLVVNLGRPALARANYATVVGDMFLGALCAMPEEDELPASGVTGILISKESTRVAVDSMITLTARVRPSHTANQEITWSSADPTIATVENGVVTGVKAGTTTITVSSKEDPTITASCTITVVDVTGPQSVGYTVSAQKDALYKFNPELPATTAEKVADFSGGTSIKGLEINGTNLWYMQDNGVFPVLYRYDLITGQSVAYGQLNTYGSGNDMAYDFENNLVYVVSGFYVFQFDVSSLSTSSLNWSTDSRDISGLIGQPTTHAITVVNGDVYFLAKGYNGCNLYKIGIDPVTHAFSGTPELILSDLAVNTNAYESEMAYDSSSELFYVTDAASRLYTFDFQGNVTLVDVLGDNIDFNGIAIAPAVSEEP